MRLTTTGKTETFAMTAALQSSNEQSIALPAARLFGTVLGVVAICVLGWLAIATLGGLSGPVEKSGIAGAAVVGAVAMLSLVILAPWKSRPFSAWMTMWLAATVARLIITPLATFLLYSVTAFDATALTISVAASYLLVLLAEVIVLAGSLHHVVQPRPRIRASGDPAHRSARQGS